MPLRRLVPAALALGLMLVMVRATIQYGRRRHLAGWSEFNRTKLRQTIQLPPEATVVDYRDRDGFWHLERDATFRLPKTRTPHEWIRGIVHQSQKERVWGDWEPSGLEFSGGPGRVWYVRYLPSRDVYEARYMVDF